jgi:hypothetical protein
VARTERGRTRFWQPCRESHHHQVRRWLSGSSSRCSVGLGNESWRRDRLPDEILEVTLVERDTEGSSGLGREVFRELGFRGKADDRNANFGGHEGGEGGRDGAGVAGGEGGKEEEDFTGGVVGEMAVEEARKKTRKSALLGESQGSSSRGLRTENNDASRERRKGRPHASSRHLQAVLKTGLACWFESFFVLKDSEDLLGVA